MSHPLPYDFTRYEIKHLRQRQNKTKNMKKPNQDWCARSTPFHHGSVGSVRYVRFSATPSNSVKPSPTKSNHTPPPMIAIRVNPTISDQIRVTFYWPRSSRRTVRT